MFDRSGSKPLRLLTLLPRERPPGPPPRREMRFPENEMDERCKRVGSTDVLVYPLEDEATLETDATVTDDCARRRPVTVGGAGGAGSIHDRRSPAAGGNCCGPLERVDECDVCGRWCGRYSVRSPRGEPSFSSSVSRQDSDTVDADDRRWSKASGGGPMGSGGAVDGRVATLLCDLRCAGRVGAVCMSKDRVRIGRHAPVPSWADARGGSVDTGVDPGVARETSTTGAKSTGALSDDVRCASAEASRGADVGGWCVGNAVTGRGGRVGSRESGCARRMGDDGHDADERDDGREGG